MTVGRRVAAVERTLDPLAVVLKVIAEAQEHASLEAYAQAIAEVPIEGAPMSRIAAEVEASVRADSKGSSREKIEQAIRRAVGDAIFRYMLFLRLNTSALEIADHDGLRAAAVFYWMGCLLSGPREAEMDPAEWEEHRREQDASWHLWRSVVASLLVTGLVEEEAREHLEVRYLGGGAALLAGSSSARERFAAQVDRIWSIAIVAAGPARPEDESTDSLAQRVAERARRIADDARISTFERLGEMSRAVAIVERRIRTNS